MRNPWLDLPSDPPYVLHQDQPTLDIWNQFADVRDTLHLDLLPQPWVGQLDAPVIALNLNPAVGATDHEWDDRAEFRDALRGCRRGEPSDYPFYFLAPALAASEGVAWWRRCLGRLIRDTSLEVVANGVLGLEFHGYKSRKFADLPVTLPSQKFVFEILREALSRDAVVFVMRGTQSWCVAVPELFAYERRFETKNHQRGSISPENSVEAHAYDEALAALTS